MKDDYTGVENICIRNINIHASGHKPIYNMLVQNKFFPMDNYSRIVHFGVSYILMGD